MQQTAPAESSADAFAGLLASLAAPSKPAPSPWDNELADDFATISYEQALRPHLRYQPTPTEPPSAQVEPAHPGLSAGVGYDSSRPSKERLKTASITIRLSEP